MSTKGVTERTTDHVLSRSHVETTQSQLSLRRTGFGTITRREESEAEKREDVKYRSNYRDSREITRVFF